jgi:hypothetical protein
MSLNIGNKHILWCEMKKFQQMWMMEVEVTNLGFEKYQCFVFWSLCFLIHLLIMDKCEGPIASKAWWSCNRASTQWRWTLWVCGVLWVCFFSIFGNINMCKGVDICLFMKCTTKLGEWLRMMENKNNLEMRKPKKIWWKRVKWFMCDA